MSICRLIGSWKAAITLLVVTVNYGQQQSTNQTIASQNHNAHSGTLSPTTNQSNANTSKSAGDLPTLSGSSSDANDARATAPGKERTLVSQQSVQLSLETATDTSAHFRENQPHQTIT